MLGGKSFDLNGKAYELRFTQNARLRLETELARRPGIGIGTAYAQIAMWAGLEGSRLKDVAERRADARLAPFTLDEVGDLMDEMIDGGLRPAAIVNEAWDASLPKQPTDSKSGEAAQPDPTQS